MAFLQGVADRYGPKPAFLMKRGLRYREWSYTDTWVQSGKVASLLRSRGVTRGDRVAIWAPNSPEWVFAFFGSIRAGAVPVPIDLRSDERFVARIVEKARPSFGFTSRFAPRSGAALGNEVLLLEELESLTAALGDPEEISIEPDDLAEIMFTSGTTGDPKGVMLTHRNILSDLEAVRKFIPGAPYYRVVSLLPLSHMFEEMAGLFLALACGADVTYITSMQPAAIMRTMKERRVVTMLLVPQVLAMFMNSIEIEVVHQGKQRMWHVLLRIAPHVPMKLRRLLFASVHRKLGGALEFFTAGGAALDPELAHKWTALGIKVLQGYGTTEAAPVISTHPLANPRYDSAGLPLPGVEVRIGSDGEILVRGDNITPGYWEDPAQTQAAFRDGWYKTGDVGAFDPDGYLHLSGRKKDMIVLSTGQNGFPDDIERFLINHPDVTECTVVGLARGTQVHAAIVVRQGGDPEAAVRWTNAQLAEHQRIHGFTVWPGETLPRTHTLKVKKHEVVETIERGVDSASVSVPQQEAKVTATLESVIAEIARVQQAEVQPHLTLGEGLGLDSLSRLELLSAIETELGAYLDETAVDAETTVEQMEALVAAHAGTKDTTAPRKWPLRGPIRAFRWSLQTTLLFPIYRFYARPRVTGLEHLDGITGPLLFATNHTSHLDSIAVLQALPARLRNRTAVAGAEDYFFQSWWLGKVSSLAVNAFPFAREGAIRPSLEYCAWLVDGGWSVLIYPEGTRSVSGEIGEFKSGTGLLAGQLGIPVVPIRLVGHADILPKGRTLPRKGHAEVHFGSPIYVGPLTTYDEATASIREAVTGLGGVSRT